MVNESKISDWQTRDVELGEYGSIEVSYRYGTEVLQIAGLPNTGFDSYRMHGPRYVGMDVLEQVDETIQWWFHNIATRNVVTDG